MFGEKKKREKRNIIKKNKLYEYIGNINMYNEITDKINIIYVFTKI